MTATWVLIVFAAGFYKGGPATIPGYLTKDACEQAGQYYEKLSPARKLSSDGYFCIPGPPARGS